MELDFKTGKIADIITSQRNDKVKRIVKLALNNKQTAFFEFQGKLITKLKDLKKGDTVKVYFEFNGKQSQLGLCYNNLLGRKIHKI